MAAHPRHKRQTEAARLALWRIVRAAPELWRAAGYSRERLARHLRRTARVAAVAAVAGCSAIAPAAEVAALRDSLRESRAEARILQRAGERLLGRLILAEGTLDEVQARGGCER